MYKRLKELRINKNLTQSQIAIFLKITSPQYSLYETGKRPVPLPILSKLAEFYDTSIDYIVGDTDQISRYK